MRITIVLAILTLTAWLFLINCNIALAKENDIGQSLIHPAHPLYFVKTIREILELKFAGTANIRGLRHLEFATRRIREVRSLVSHRRQDLIQPTLENYWFNLNKLLGLINFRDEVIGNQVILEIRRHIITLQRAYDQIENARAKMALRTTINRISGWNIQLLDRLTLDERGRLSPKLAQSQILICNFLSKEASQSALNEVERVVLKERADKCNQSLILLH